MNEGVENDSDDFKAQYYVAYSADGKDKFDDALNNAKMCNEHGDYANAVKYAENASEYDDLRGDALYELAYAEFSTQNLSLAARDIAESLKILDTKADVKHVLLAAYIFCRFGRIAKRRGFIKIGRSGCGIVGRASYADCVIIRVR